MILGLGLILLLVLGAIAIAPKKQPALAAPSGTPQPLLMQASAPAPAYAPQVSFRQQLVDEKANEVAAAFRDAEQKKWRAEVIKEAADLLASP
jgi:hypothetical protein